MRATFFTIGIALPTLIIGGVALLVLALGPGKAWEAFVEFATVWGNVIGVVGFLLGTIGFGITCYGFGKTWDERNRIRAAVNTSLETAANRTLSSIADEAERILLEFKDAVRRGAWHRAGEKCDDAEHRIAKMIDIPHLSDIERADLATGMDDLRLVSRYITKSKTLKDKPAQSFHVPKMEAVDSIVDILRTIRSRTSKKVWET